MKRLALLMLAMLALASCIQYNEELWINPDSSGRAMIRVKFRSEFLNTSDLISASQKPGISDFEYSIAKTGEYFIYNISFKFNSIDTFNNVNDLINDVDPWGKISLNRSSGGKVSYTRRISVGNQEESDDGIDQIFAEIHKQKQPENPTWSYKVHLPWKIISSNADEGNIDRENKTVKWVIDPRNSNSSNAVMTVEMEKTLPWVPIILVAIVVLLLGIIVLWMIRIARRSHLLDRLDHHRRHNEDSRGSQNMPDNKDQQHQ